MNAKPPRIAVCPGSFDPPTEGHINIVRRGLKIFDKVIVAVAVNAIKKAILTKEERVALLQELFQDAPGVEVDAFEGRLLVDYVRDKKAATILRGLRTIADYDYEFQMALANKKLAPEIETVFMMTESQNSFISSSLIKEILGLGGSTQGMIPALVEAKFKKRIKK